MSISVLPRLLTLLLFCPALCMADDSKTDVGGHTKLRVIGQTYPADSVLRDLAGSDSVDVQGDLRLNLEARAGRWSFDASYQLVAFNGETFQLPSDERRLFDLTSVVERGRRSALLHRLDRLWVGYASEKIVVRFGRQALSWGNGFFYAPMDLVNPFNPASVDTEYKSGDDMWYMQRLHDNGSDLQGAYVFRRDPRDGNVETRQATIAIKYHGFTGNGEFDLLVAQHYGDIVLGAGGNRAIGGAIWGGDLVLTDTDLDIVVQLTTNLSYSWNWAGKNMSGVLEYYFNGFGQHADEYDPQSLTANPDLVSRLARGESFALGRHFLAGSILIELTPLWSVSPTVLANIGDPSSLFQLITNFSLSNNMTLLGSLNIPLGSNGTEFGGIESGIPGRYLSTGASVFAQIAWYF